MREEKYLGKLLYDVKKCSVQANRITALQHLQKVVGGKKIEKQNMKQDLKKAQDDNKQKDHQIALDTAKKEGLQQQVKLLQQQADDTRKRELDDKEAKKLEDERKHELDLAEAEEKKEQAATYRTQQQLLAASLQHNLGLQNRMDEF